MQTFKYGAPSPIAQPVFHLMLSDVMIQKIIAEIEDGGAPSIRMSSIGDQVVRSYTKSHFYKTLILRIEKFIRVSPRNIIFLFARIQYLRLHSVFRIIEFLFRDLHNVIL
jgi:hypothetical protein